MLAGKALKADTVQHPAEIGATTIQIIADHFAGKEVPAEVPRRHVDNQDHGLDKALDVKLIEKSRAAIDKAEKVSFMAEARKIKAEAKAAEEATIGLSEAQVIEAKANALLDPLLQHISFFPVSFFILYLLFSILKLTIAGITKIALK